MSDKKELLKKLADLGFPLLEVTEEADVNVTLAEVVKSHDLRLWEGFPEVLAFSAEMEMFKYEKTKEYLTTRSDKMLFDLLLSLSLALYKTLHLKFAWANELYRSFDEKNKKQVKVYSKALKDNQDLRLNNYLVSAQRLKTTFNNYFKREQTSLKDLLSQKEELGLEYALSQVFSPKQKELFLKKLKGEKFTKTEKEYFSRAVKKKVLALANFQLHSLARKLLE